MRSIAVINQKGGSGKTTTVVNLAAALGELKRRVLVIDLDPQASASLWFGIKNGGKGIQQFFSDSVEISSLVRDTGAEGVQILPSSQWLLGVEKALTGKEDAELILQKKLRNALSHGFWDYILVDCPPSLGILTINALAAVEEVIVTVEAHVLALYGLTKVVQTIDLVQERLNPDLRLSGILACRINGRARLNQDVMQKLRQGFQDTVFNTFIRENIYLAEAPSFRMPITQYYSRCRGAEDYRSLAKEVIKQEEKEKEV